MSSSNFGFVWLWFRFWLGLFFCDIPCALMCWIALVTPCGRWMVWFVTAFGWYIVLCVGGRDIARVRVSECVRMYVA